MSIETKPKVRLVGMDGNSFMIMGAVQKAMRTLAREDNQYDYEKQWADYQEDATSGDYDNLLQATMRFCEVS